MRRCPKVSIWQNVRCTANAPTTSGGGISAALNFSARLLRLSFVPFYAQGTHRVNACGTIISRLMARTPSTAQNHMDTANSSCFTYRFEIATCKHIATLSVPGIRRKILPGRRQATLHGRPTDDEFTTHCDNEMVEIGRLTSCVPCVQYRTPPTDPNPLCQERSYSNGLQYKCTSNVNSVQP